MNFVRTAVAAHAIALGLSIPSAWAETVTIRVGFIPVIGGAQLFVMDREGWAKDAGINLVTTQFESGPNMIQALASGTLDAYSAGIGPLVVARAKGVGVRVVAATAIEELVTVGTGKLGERFKAGEAPAAAFKAFRAASGKPARIATQPAGSVPNTMLQHWLWEVAKVDKADVEIVPMGIDATQQALLARAVDAATVREPALTILQERDPQVQIAALGGVMFPDQPGHVFALTDSFVEKNPLVAQRFVDLTVRATKLLLDSPDKGAPAVQNALGKGLVSLQTVQKALASPATKFNADPRRIVAATGKMQTFQLQIGAIDKTLPLEGLFDSSFYEKAASAGR
jgi:NitT/TauT family transport system substrate-binding protein